VRRSALALLLLLLACHREVGPPPADSLVGLELPLRVQPTLQLALDGLLDGRPAEVLVDLSQPVSFVSDACLDEPPLSARVKVADAFGPDETFALTRVRGLSLGGTRFRPFEAALAGGKTCVVVLGQPELADAAVELDPTRRRLRFRPSQSREAWLAEAQASGDEAQVLTLEKEPRYDWPLLPVRVRQDGRTASFALVVSLRESRSRLFEASAQSAGLRSAADALASLGSAEAAKLARELPMLQAWKWDTLELSPGFGVEGGGFEREPGAPPHAPQGVLGADVWGRFLLALDVREGVLVLRRPRLLTSGSRVQCERGGRLDEAACFEVHARPVSDGLAVTVTVWRPLAEGGQLSLDLVGAPAGACRVGVGFGPGDRGRSSQHVFPWQGLEERVPACDGAFTGAMGAEPGLFEESPMPQCPGVCAWARDAVSGRVACECQPRPRTLDADGEKRLLEMLKRLDDERAAPREQEPQDPP
jgi:hypothetical protein